MVKILVVEDEANIRSSIIDMLELANHDVFEAANGDEALHILQDNLPDLIISDIMMPTMDGFEFFEAIKQDLATAHIPFIFLTALANYEDIRSGMNLGADDYLTKPFDYNQLTNAVNARLDKHTAEEQAQLHRFAQGLVNAQERERSGLAHSIETELQEPLNGLKMMLNIAQQSNDISILSNISNLTDELIELSRGLSLRLMPTMIHHLNIMATLNWLFEQYKTQHKLNIDFERSGFTPELYTNEKISIYRVFDEVLTNILRHSKAKNVTIRITVNKDTFYADIRDDGQGFDVQEALVSDTIGLRIMFERIALLNGDVNIHSIIGDGTQITLNIPVRLGSDEDVQDHTAPISPPKKKPVSISNIRILIADDYDVIRHGLQQIISQESSMTVVAQAGTRSELLRQLRQQDIDVVVLDMMMDDSSGFDFIKVIRQQMPQIKIIAFSNQRQEVYAVEAIKSGANAYLLKESNSLEILDAIYKVANGEQYIGNDLADKVLEWMLNAKSETSSISNIIDMLTNREREIMLQAIEGLTSAEIGERLMISPRTVEKHRSNFMSKLGLKTPAQLMKFASEQGLIQ